MNGTILARSRSGRAWLAAYAVPSAPLILIAAFGEKTAEWTALSIVLACACGVVLASRPLLARTRRTLAKTADMTVTEYTYSLVDAFFLWLESRVPVIRRARKASADSLVSLIRAAGTSYDIEGVSTRAARLSVALVPISLAAAVALAALHGPLFLALAAAPAVAYVSPNVSLRLATLERRSRTEEEAAYFLCYVNIMQEVGWDLYASFKSILGERIFAGMERDAKEIVKRVEMLGLTKAASLSEYAEHHPSQSLKQFVDGYLAKLESVGDVPWYTREKVRYFFSEYRNAWTRYARSAQEIMSGVMMVTIILPMMVMMAAMIGTAEIAGTMLMAVTFLSPFVSIVVVVLLNSGQPMTGIVLPFHAAGPAAFAASLAALAAAGAPGGTVIAAAAMVGGLANAVAMRGRIGDEANVERTLPEFLRDITELSKTGSNITEIVTRQARRKAYGGKFGGILRHVTAEMRTGAPFGDAIRGIGHGSVTLRFVFFLLEKTHRTGSGTAQVYAIMTEFIGDVLQIRSHVKRSLSSMAAIVYVSPFLLLGTVHLMLGVMAADTPAEGGLTLDVPFSGSLSSLADERYVERFEVLAAAVCIPMGLVASKITGHTVKNTVPLAIVGASTVLAIEIIPIAVSAFGFGGP